MNAKLVVAAAAALTLIVSAAAPTQAYTLHHWQDGTVSWLCNDGITAGVMDDGSMPPESVVIAACADYGGIVAPPANPKTSKAERARR